MLQKQLCLAQEKVLQAKHFLVLYTVLYGFVFVWFGLVWFCICMVLYLCGSYLYGFVLVWFVLVWFCICVVCTCMVLYLYGLYLCGFVLVWVVLVWFVLVWFCICMVLYLYGFILFLLRPCGGAPAIQQGIADEAILTYYEM